MFQGNLLGELKDLMNATSGLDRAGYRETVICFDIEATMNRSKPECLLQLLGTEECRLDDAFACLKLGEQRCQHLSETMKTIGCVKDFLASNTLVFPSIPWFPVAVAVGVCPEGWGAIGQ